MKQKFVDYYMRVAEETAALSYAQRLQVGCVIVKDGRTLSFGYNGTPSGWDNCCEDTYQKYDERLGNNVISTKTKSIVLHAEMNCLMKLCQSHESSRDATLFITHSPCMDCAKAIYQAGISQVIYKNKYRDNSGIQFLIDCGVSVLCHKEMIGSNVRNVMKNLS